MVRRNHARLQHRQLLRLAAAGRALRSLRSTAGAPHRLLRPRDQLLRHRALDGDLDADRRARAERLDAGDGARRQRLRRRHHAARGAGAPLRPARRDVRARLHPRPGRRRPARRDRPAPAVLRGRQPRARQPAVRLVRAARVAAARSASAVRPAHRVQPDQGTDRARPARRHRPAGRGDRVHGALAVHALHDVGALRDLQVRLGPARERLVAVRGRRDVGAGAGRAARATAEALLAAAPGDRGPRVVDARLRRLGRRRPRAG